MASSPTLQPEQDRVDNGFARSSTRRRACPGSSSRAAQPRDAGPLPAGLDVQDGHGRGRARRRRSSRRLDVLRPRLLHRVRQAGLERAATPTRTARGVRQRRPRRRRYQHSINAVFCNIGKKLGAKRDPRQGEGLRLLLEAAASSCRRTSVARERALQLQERTALRRRRTQVDPGRLAFGQEHLLVTPLQMALVAAGVANGGTSWRRTSSRRSPRRAAAPS